MREKDEERKGRTEDQETAEEEEEGRRNWSKLSNSTMARELPRKEKRQRWEEDGGTETQGSETTQFKQDRGTPSPAVWINHRQWRK